MNLALPINISPISHLLSGADKHYEVPASKGYAAARARAQCAGGVVHGEFMLPDIVRNRALAPLLDELLQRETKNDMERYRHSCAVMVDFRHFVADDRVALLLATLPAGTYCENEAHPRESWAHAVLAVNKAVFPGVDEEEGVAAAASELLGRARRGGAKVHVSGCFAEH